MFHNPLKTLRVIMVVVDIAPKTEEMKVKEASETKKEEVFVLKPLTHKQLAEMYGVSWLTIMSFFWIGVLSTTPSSERQRLRATYT